MTESADSRPEAVHLSQWRRLSVGALWFLLLRGAARNLREQFPLVVGAGAGATLIDRIGVSHILVAVSAVVLIGVLLAIGYFRRFRFRMEEDALVLEQGLFQRRTVRVAAERVQAISLDQPLLMRPFRLVHLRVSTAGGVSDQVELPGIPGYVAVAIQQRIGKAQDARHAHVDGGDGPIPPNPALYRASLWALTLHGLSNHAVYVSAMVILPVVSTVERALRPWLAEWEAGALRGFVSDSPVGWATLLTLIAVVAMITAVGLSWWRHYGAVVTQHPGQLTLRGGFGTKREQVLALNRVMAVEWAQSALGRLVGRGYLVCRQLGSPAPGPADQSGRSFLVPGLRWREAASLIHACLSGGALDRALEQVSPRYGVAVATRTVAMAAAALALAAVLTDVPPPVLAGLAMLACGVATANGYLRWRLFGWHVGVAHVHVRRGGLGQRTVMCPLDAIQTVCVQQSWIQRRRGLATLRLGLATGPERIPWIPLSQANTIANRLVWRIEGLMFGIGSATTQDSRA